MHAKPETSVLSDDALLGGTPVFRSGELDDRRHRLRPNDAADQQRERQQGPIRAALTATLETAQNLLASVQAGLNPVSRVNTGVAVRGNVDSKGDQSVSQAGRDSEKGPPTRTATFLRDGAAGSGRRFDGDQSVAGSRVLHDDDGLPALPPRAPEFGAEPAGLAAGRPDAIVSPDRRERSSRQQAERRLERRTEIDRKSQGKTASEPEADTPTVAGILKQGASSYVTASTPKRQRDTLAKISLCRTNALGGRRYQCEDCDSVTTRYNSCGDRHCPQCSGSRRVDFHDKTSKLILDGVTYYQVVMTLPAELSDLATRNRTLFGDLLPKAAWSSVNKSIRSEQSYEAAALSVLHTWNQHLQSHWHVHLLVPGAGPRIDTHGNPTTQWKEASPPVGAENDKGFYLVDADRLRESYRDTFLRRLKSARRSGKLALTGRHEYLRSDENWAAFIRNMESKQWVAFIQPPPTDESSAQTVVRYLTRYLTGGPIGDSRIISLDNKGVCFLAREGVRVGGDRKQVPVHLTLREFVARWCLHIQPEQLTKVRYFGGWSNTKVGSYQERCKSLLPEPRSKLTLISRTMRRTAKSSQRVTRT